MFDLTGKEADLATLPRHAAGRSLLFLAAVYIGLEIYLWWIIPHRNRAAIAGGAVVILLVAIVDPIRRRESWRTLGLDFHHFGAAVTLLLAPTLAGLFASAITHNVIHGMPPSFTAFGRRFLAILPWAFLQQLLLQGTFNRRLSSVFGTGFAAVILTGVAFAGMHLPGAFLTLATFVYGTIWARAWQRSPNLWALVLSHALLSAVAQASLPAAWTHGFRVGPGWFRWHP